MDERTKELIAIGASVGAHCQPCLTWHVEKARKLGIDDEDIRTAIETGHMVEKGAMSAMRKFSANILDTASSITELQ
jgi:AhpD family alkylhydroperoxidase